MIKNTLRKVKHKTRVRTRIRDGKKKVETVRYIYRTNGSHGLKMYVKDGVRKRLERDTHLNETGDVLFVTIDNEMLNHYRVDHMTETLESAGMSVGKVLYYNLKPEHIKRYNVFVFYRCPWMPEYTEIFKDIRHKNKVSIYAVDDLVIDRKYTDNLPVVQQLLPEDRAIYDDGVERHGKLMKHCDYAITTTGALADELKNYKNLKQVYIDRNMRNDETIFHSDEAIKSVKRDDSKVIIGYFSGTNTHNEDFQMVAPALIQVLEKHDNVYVKLTGRLDPPKELEAFKDRLIYTPLVDWRRLPYEMRECHITLAPLVDTIFNRGKSELKWADAALVEVPTVTSDLGAGREVVADGKTGVLVNNTDDAWFDGINRLVSDANLRSKIGASARQYVLENYSTTGKKAMKLHNFIEEITPNVIAFAGVNISAISGGNMVVKKHMDILREAGNIVYGVESMDYHEKDRWEDMNRRDDEHYDIFRINSHRKTDKTRLKISFDRYVSTFWSSVNMVDRYQYVKQGGKKLYLVQNMEAGFYRLSDKTRRKVMSTYFNHRVVPVTISKWCQAWLKDDFGRDAKYAPNGIDLDQFQYKKRDWSGRKIKILIEGDSASDYKRVDESFDIANRLDKTKYEVSYLSYNAKPKDWYQVDNVYIGVPYDKVAGIYQQHDILIKSSVLESFSYPPIEMMATGGVTVLAKNDGNAEYVVDGKNAIYYQSQNVSDAVKKIENLVADKSMFDELSKSGRSTATKRSWDSLKDQIVELYD